MTFRCRLFGHKLTYHVAFRGGHSYDECERCGWIQYNRAIPN